jgi:hypothetical protein
VNRGHPLLEVDAAAEDCTAVDPTWGAHDDGGGPGMIGRGAQVAGLALYGDLTPVLAGSDPVQPSVMMCCMHVAAERRLAWSARKTVLHAHVVLGCIHHEDQRHPQARC